MSDVPADPVDDQPPHRLGLALRTRVAVAVALVAAAIAVLLFGPADDAPKLMPGLGTPNSVGESAWGVARGETEVFGGIPLCLDRSGRITITSVRGYDATPGFRIDAFAIHINPDWPGRRTPGRRPMIGNAAGTLAENHVPLGWRVLHLTCDEAGRGYMMTIQVTNGAEGIASAHALDISYVSSGEHQMLRVPVAIALCPEGHSTRACTRVFNSF